MRIENGEILDGDKVVGTANKGLKFGYHPAVKVEVNGKVEWFEFDTPDLINKIIQYAEYNLA